jgi:transcription initiation factor IIE alpha subunit
MTDTCCKVGEVIEARDLDEEVSEAEFDDSLVSRWVGANGYPETGLRPLADWFNEQLLKRAYIDHGRSTIETRIESEYRALTSDDDIARGEVVDDLATDGIDGDELSADFVSKSTLQRHLTNCLDVEKASDERSEREWEKRRVEYVKETIGENVTGALRSLENRGELPGATAATVETPVLLQCPECGTRVRFETAAQRGYVCREHLGTASSNQK